MAHRGLAADDGMAPANAIAPFDFSGFQKLLLKSGALGRLRVNVQCVRIGNIPIELDHALRGGRRQRRSAQSRPIRSAIRPNGVSNSYCSIAVDAGVEPSGIVEIRFQPGFN